MKAARARMGRAAAATRCCAEARPCAEGRGIRFPVRSPADVRTVRALVALKVGPPAGA